MGDLQTKVCAQPSGVIVKKGGGAEVEVKLEDETKSDAECEVEGDRETAAADAIFSDVLSEEEKKSGKEEDSSVDVVMPRWREGLEVRYRGRFYR